MEDFRRDLAETTPEQLGDRLVTYELNLLMRLAAAWGLAVHVDTVERGGYTEVIVRMASEPGGKGVPRKDAP